MSYKEDVKLQTRDCDRFGRWKPSAVMEAMQEIAIAHCETAGLGRSVTDGMGVVWVLSRCRVELSRLPLNGERLSIETFALPSRHLFFPRAHVFRDARGQLLGGAQGLWLLLDVRTRRAVVHPSVVAALPVESRDAPAAAPATVRPLEGPPTAGDIAPGFVDFDINGHVNNARYLDWCCNALGFEALQDREIACFDVNYDREILPGEAVRAELCLQGDAFSFIGESGGRRCFGIGGRFRSAAPA